jgi:alkanesulfonate monooxygenase SsuD/methylene tetrahydromethanopterin reductase-like flavin-dependent oxidoreductase (luciferase family)
MSGLSSQEPLAVGLMLPSAARTDSRLVDPQRLLASARLAEAAGFDSVEVGDHLLHPHPLLESLTTLAAVAAVTTRVTIGTCVLLAALRSAEWLAKQLGTIDAFAPGRLRIGIGLGGEYPAEFDLAQVPLSERGKRTEEIIRELRRWFSPEQGIWGSSEIPMVLAPVPQKNASYPFRRVERCRASPRGPPCRRLDRLPPLS